MDNYPHYDELKKLQSSVLRQALEVSILDMATLKAQNPMYGADPKLDAEVRLHHKFMDDIEDILYLRAVGEEDEIT